MTGAELINKLEDDFPLESAVAWDNTGLQAGRREKVVQRIYIALDATEEVIAHAEAFGAHMLLTHHPLLMSGIKSVTTDDQNGRRLIHLLQQDMLCYAMHTNYDVKKMGDICSKKLGLEEIQVLDEGEGIGKIGKFHNPITLEECAKQVKQAFDLEKVKIFAATGNLIDTVAIVPGSGKSMIHTALEKKASLLITGDIGHHEGIDAMEQGLTIMDAGHYGLEHVFLEDMKNYIENMDCELRVACEPIHSPFFYA